MLWAWLAIKLPHWSIITLGSQDIINSFSLLVSFRNLGLTSADLKHLVSQELDGLDDNFLFLDLTGIVSADSVWELYIGEAEYEDGRCLPDSTTLALSATNVDTS